MIDFPLQKNSFSCEAARRLDVGGVRVDFVVVTVSEDVSSPVRASHLAEELVAMRIGCERRFVHVATLMPSGRPVATVRGRAATIFLSTSNAGGLAGAVSCVSGGVGLDIVDVAEAGRPLETFFTPDERALVRGNDGRMRARLWAAKEAAYKAARLDEGFRPLAVAIEPVGPMDFSWSVQGIHRRVEGKGVFATAGKRVVAVAVASISVEQRARSA